MPTFFDPANMTPAQAGRYQWALAEYSRVTQHRAGQRPHSMAACIARQPERTAAGTVHAPAGPGPKSALFARLLEGKPALPFPPPTTFSYPWYSLIEQGRATDIDLGGTIALGNHFSGTRGQRRRRGLLINQCLWTILGENNAADELMALSNAIASTNGHLSEPDAYLVQRILKRRPEWTVCHGESGNFRVYMGRVIARGRRSALMQDRIRTDFTGANPVVRQVLQTYRDERSMQLARIAQLLAKPPALRTDTERLALAAEENHREPATPSDFDWVIVERDGWCMERA